MSIKYLNINKLTKKQAVATTTLNAMLLEGKHILLVTFNHLAAKSMMEDIKKLYTSLPNNMYKSGVIRWGSTVLEFDNGSKVYVCPIGLAEEFVCGYSFDLVIMDEAAFYPNEVVKKFWYYIIPAIEHNKGSVIILSTRSSRSKKSFFWSNWLKAENFKNPNNFKPFKLAIKDCPHITKARLKELKKNMSRAAYDREFTIRTNS